MIAFVQVVRYLAASRVVFLLFLSRLLCKIVMKLLSDACLAGVVVFFGFAAFLVGTVHGETFPSRLLGDWSLDLSTGEPAWMRVEEQSGKPVVSLRIYVGSLGPFHDVDVVDGRVKFDMAKKSKGKRVSTTSVNVGLVNGELDGVMVRTGIGSRDVHGDEDLRDACGSSGPFQGSVRTPNCPFQWQGPDRLGHS